MKSTKHTRALAYEILAYWERFNHHDQSTWVGDEDKVKIRTETLSTGVDVNVCSTTMCAAGTAVFLSTTPEAFKQFVKVSGGNEWEAAGGRLLGLDHEEAYKVFYAGNKSAKRLMKAIASGSQEKFEKALAKRKSLDEEQEQEDF
jgi:hypothetical protein